MTQKHTSSTNSRPQSNCKSTSPSLRARLEEKRDTPRIRVYGGKLRVYGSGVPNGIGHSVPGFTGPSLRNYFARRRTSAKLRSTSENLISRFSQWHNLAF